VIPSIDYLTLVIAGAFLVVVSEVQARKNDGQRIILSFLLAGAALFLIGTIRALMSAFGL
jgi:hypothetical protein